MVVGDHDGRRRAHGIDGVAVRVRYPRSGIACLVCHSGIVQCDQVASALQVGGRRKGGCPGDATITAADGAQRAAADVQVAVVKVADGLAEGNGHQRGVTDLQMVVGDHDGGCRRYSVNAHVGGVGNTIE